MSRDAPSWLGELQARFGAVIRTPLDRGSGTLTAVPSSYDARLVDDATQAERLAVYNRQYWFRLFEVLQTAFPLTTRLVGHWSFNEHAARFLLEHPPRGWDVDHVPDGFEAFFCAAVEEGARVEAVRIDGAWRTVFRAPPVAPYRPSAADAARLLDARLMPSPAVAIVEEHWPLLELRKKLRDDPSEKPAVVPPPLDRSRFWALVRREEGIGQLPIEAREAQLFALLRTHTVRDALTKLEEECSEAERTELPAKARAWLGRSVELDFWVGIARDLQSQMTQL